MWTSFLRKSSYLRRPICTACYKRQPFQQFHTSRVNRVPIVPMPAFILGALKTGKLVSLVSLSSKTSLTLLPHTFRRGGKIDLVAKILAGIPLFGFTLLVVVGLDQAPNTSRLRLVYLTEEEEAEIMEAEIDTLLKAQSGLVAPRDSEVVMWLQTIVDNLSIPASDDIRDPVRKYADNPYLKSRHIQPIHSPPSEPMDTQSAMPKRHFEVDVIWDSTTVNAMCAGSRLVVYNLLLDYLDYDTQRMAVILSHEIAHSIQRHLVEQHGFASLMFMLGDITRGVFWMVTESLGPYINQKINDSISTFITMETQTTYNRRLEKEADLVGLKILAKAGYDPQVAVDVWERLADLENVLGEDEKKKHVFDPQAILAKRSISSSSEQDVHDLDQGVREFLSSVVNSWFGSSHPPNLERIEYMREHMQEAIALYQEALRINGPPREFIFSEDIKQQQSIETHQNGFLNWLSFLYAWI